MSIEVDSIIDQSPDTIFQKYSLQQVQQISLDLENKSDLKHEELRQLVASKYRDLLSTADEIIDMNKISKIQDKKLYDLSFLKNEKLIKNSKIEKNIEIWLNLNNKNYNNIENEIELKRTNLIKNSGFYLQMSELLNLNNDDSWEKIIEILIKIPLNENWFKLRINLLNEKFKELEMILFNKVNELKQIEELKQIDEFFQINFKKFGFNLNLFQEILSKRLLNLINSENLILILKNFNKFKFDFLKVYNDDIILKINELESLIKKINDDNENNNDDNELKLYELNLDNDEEYLKNIEYLNNGLIFKNYQLIDHLIKQSFKDLNIIEKIDLENFQKNKNSLIKIIESFKLHSIKKQNKPLLKYLNQIKY